MKYLQFECPNCGLIKRIPLHKGIYQLILYGEIKIVCNLCCYKSHWKLNILFFELFKEKHEQRKLEKRYLKFHKKSR